ncbi:MAG: ACP S-malonyltransferase [Gammaproteobacteria bacterium]|nr:ACP S-malonyltransferase [Gammaproteobacteria bacterium]
MTNLAFVFPGQGSQSVGMIADLYENHQSIRNTFEEASAVLSMDLGQLILEGPAEDLNRTDNTQPALLATSVALYRHWLNETQIIPAILAGHSLGEYSALVCADVIPFDDALKLVKQRGEFMMQAVPAGTGAMAAILGLDNELVEQSCREAAQEQVVSPVNYNSPGQLVIAGHKDAVARVIESCKAAGAKRALPLPVSVPSHCALMKPAADKLAEVMSDITFSEPSIPVINNVDVMIETRSDKITDALQRQLYNPVRWTETVQSLQEQSVTTILECGPGKVLAGLCKRIDRSITALVSCDQTGFDKSMEALK